jgi:uncharacterized LabA/DUF88 family protein
MLNQKIFKLKKSNNINMLPGDSKESPDESFLKEILVFIDEAFLSKLSNYFGEGKYLKFDRFSFARRLAEKEKTKLAGVFLYIAPPFQSQKSTKEEELKKEGYDHLINKLKEKGIIVREGRCQRLKINGKFKYNQKAVDILLTMDLMSVPLKYSNIKRIVLISSDSDFVPVIKSLEQQGILTILYTYYTKKRDSPFSRSNYLIKSVYKYKLIQKEDMQECVLK